MKKTAVNWKDRTVMDDIEKRRRDGESLRSIARSMDVCYQSIQYWREVYGLPKLKVSQKTGKDHPNWRGGSSIDSYGYRLIYSPERIKSHPYTYEHVLAAEKQIGRRLRKNEHVHHINEQKLDNRPENLLVCTASEHRTLHRQLEALAVELLQKGQIVYRDGKYVWS